MTKEEIIAGNRLIAEFMGYVNLRSAKEYPLYKIPDHSYEANTFDGRTETIDTFELNWDLCFLTSWDWLIPVINKAHETNEYSKYVDDTCNIISDGGIFINTKFIESTFENVVEFIKWYNQNK